MSFSDVKFDRLKEAIEWSGRQLQNFREKRLEAIKQYVGYHYAIEGTQRKVPVNMLKLAVDIYTRALAARAPRVLISTKIPELKPTAANLELAVNEIPVEIQLGQTLRQYVLEALFMIGVAKIGLHTVGQVFGEDYGESFVDIITMDDYIVDMSAKTRDQIQFEGNDYWLTDEEIKNWLGKGIMRKLADEEYDQAALGEQGEERAEGIIGGGERESYQKRRWLRDIWLPGEGLILTYAVKSKKLLNTLEWEGPEIGPYHVLGFAEVPGNILPLAPIGIWFDLHELANALFRKLSRQADAQKSVLGFDQTSEDSADLFKKASDGDGIRYSGTEPKTLTAGGVDAKTLAFFMQCKDLFSYYAGNLESLGGLAPMAETLGQDKLLSQAAGAQLREMAAKTTDAVRGIFRALAWYEWHDPIKTRTLEKPIPGLPEESFLIPWTPESRQGSFDVYDLDIDVYSQIDDSPSLRLQRLGFIMSQYVLPLLPEIQRQGGHVDIQAILELVAKYSDFPELSDIIAFAEGSPADQQLAEGMVAPSETKRTYERVSRPGATPQGKSDVLQRILLGDRPQQAEAAVLG